MGDCVSIPTGLPPMLLARYGLWMSRNMHSSIYNEYYSYFLNKYDKVRQEDLSDLAYYVSL